MPAGRSQRRLALAVVLVSIVFFLAAAPFAQLQLAAVPAFIPIIASTLVVNDLITAVLLLGQFRLSQSRALLVLASAYLFNACMTVAHALTFPGVFSPTGLLGAGPQSAAWLYIFWHSGFPIFVVAYALLKDERRATSVPRGRARSAVLAGVAAVLVAAGGLTFFAAAWQGLLPALMEGDRIADLGFAVLKTIWLSSVLALAVLWRRRPHSVIDVWLMVVLCAWVFDIAMSAILNAGRFDLGFYAGRIYGLLAASFVLIMLLLENSAIYARLAEAHAGERERSAQLEAANKEFEAFSYSVSHDLRAPLRAIDGFSRIVLEDYAGKLDIEGRRLLGVIRHNSQKMAHLIDDLLEYSRLGRKPLSSAEIDMNRLFEEVLEESRESGERSPGVVLEALPPAQGDATLVKQALANLLANAIKFSGKRAQQMIEVSGVESGAECVYCVKDNGAGFDMRYNQKLFKVFQRLHREEEFDGTGVGLAIVQRVVARHGGRVWAEGKVDKGAAFYFSLPRSKPAEVGLNS